MAMPHFQIKPKISLVLLILALLGAITLYQATESLKYSDLKINNTVIKVRIADTPMEQARGLSGLATLAQDKGLLFVFNQPTIPRFWMKEMRFPIDIIWIDEEKQIIGIEHNLSPNTFPQIYSPNAPIIYALEVNATWTKQHNINIGDFIHFKR